MIKKVLESLLVVCAAALMLAIVARIVEGLAYGGEPSPWIQTLATIGLDGAVVSALTILFFWPANQKRIDVPDSTQSNGVP